MGFSTTEFKEWLSMQDDIRAQLIRQFPSEVVETADAEGTLYYACPTCRRPVAMRQEKCIGCGQVLSWEGIRRNNERKGLCKGRIEFDLPIDFTPGDCRKCPLSYIGRQGDENVYECPLNLRGSCKLQIVD